MATVLVSTAVAVVGAPTSTAAAALPPSSFISTGGASDAASLFKYVALGDSFSAGEGIEPYFPADPGNRCHRSPRAYPTMVEEPGRPGRSIRTRQLAGDTGVQWGFQACSGAVTENVWDHGNNGDPLAQLATDRAADTNPNDLPVDALTDLVTITIGGNDLEFADMLWFCFVNADCTTARLPASSPGAGRRVAGYQQALRVRLSPELDRVYARIHQQAPDAQILVLGYPHLFPGRDREQRCEALGLGFSPTEQDLLRRVTSEANRLIAARVRATHLDPDRMAFVPLDRVFAGHEICGRDGEWIHAPTLAPGWPPRVDQQSFHPNRAGQRDGYAVAVNDLLNPVPRPDGRIRLGRAGTDVGDDRYNATGLGQTRQGAAPLGRTIAFLVSIQNDGPVAGRFRLQGEGSEGAFEIRYRHQGIDITRQVLAGMYLTPTVETGTDHLIEVRVTARRSPGSPLRLSRTLTATSPESGRRDAVRFVARRS